MPRNEQDRASRRGELTQKLRSVGSGETEAAAAAEVALGFEEIAGLTVNDEGLAICLGIVKRLAALASPAFEASQQITYVALATEPPPRQR